MKPRHAIAAFLLLLFSGVGSSYAISPMPPHTDYRPGYDSSCDGGSACHNINQGRFLSDTLDYTEAPNERDFTRFCLMCHNVAGEAHAKAAGSPSTNAYVNRTGFKYYTSFRGNSHSWDGTNKFAGTSTPTLPGFKKNGGAGTDFMPGGKVRCQTCHSGMEKTGGIENIDWAPGTDQGDHKRYRITVIPAITNTRQYLSQYIRVYRNTGAPVARPTNSRSKKTYLVDPSEYTYDYQNANVVFGTAQASNAYIYIDITQPYFREDNTANRVCLDCHRNRGDRAVSHGPGTGAKDNHPVSVVYGNRSGLHNTLKSSADGNIYMEGGKVYCTSCHDVHNAASNDGELLRAADGATLCTSCHKVNGFNGYSTALLANHSGPKHRASGKPATVCRDCHTTHGSNNVMLIRNVIGGKRVNFRNFSGSDSFGNDNGSSVCEACHTATAFHKRDETGKGHNTGKNCLLCHGHNKGFSGGGGSCLDCHGTAGAEVDDYVYGNGVRATINTAEFSGAGHGRTTNYPYTNNAGANKTCNDCHDSGVNHNTRGNPFRLKDADTVALCTGCHPSVGNHDESHVGQGTWGFQPKCVDCHDPHGDSGGITAGSYNGAMVQSRVAYRGSGVFGVPTSAMPEAVDFPTRYSVAQFNWSSFVSKVGANKGVCRVCHSQPTTNYFTRRTSTSHNSAGGACTACHGHGSGFKPTGCVGCHGTTGAETDDYVYDNGVKATVNTNEYNSAGHGRTANYPYTNNSGANKDCDACHDSNVGHGVSANPFRLKDADTVALCTGCHGAATIGNHDLAHVNSGTWDWQPKCVDCHDPHGDRGGITAGSYNGAMVQSRVAYMGSGVFGVPTSVTPEAVDFPARYSVTQFNWSSFVGKVGPNKGICRVCHSQPTTGNFTRTNYTSHNPGQACTHCHPHDKGFKGGGSPCYDCHDGSTADPDIKALMGLGAVGGKASRHVISSDTAAGSTCLEMCHTNEHKAGSSNIKAASELELCNSASCHNGGTGTTSRGKGISIGGSYAASMHNYTAAMPSDYGRFNYPANCTKCHLPHGGDNYPVLRPVVKGRATDGGGEDLCFACHDGGQPSMSNIEYLWNAGYPANKGHYDYAGGKRMECVSCHGPHGTRNDKMISDSLGGPGLSRDAICRACHSGSGSVYNVMGDAPGSYNNFSATSQHDFGLHIAMGGYAFDLTCEGCHDPHYTKNARLMQDTVVFTSVSGAKGVRYVSVSTVSAKVERFGPVTAYIGGWNKYCVICHPSMAETGGQSPYRRHPSAVGLADYSTEIHVYRNAAGGPDAPLESGGVSCITCHFTHGSPKRSLLRFVNATTPDNRQCLKCHDKGTFLGGGPGSHGGFLKYEGNCADCHNMHTKANKRLLTESTESVLCKACHSGGVGLKVSRYNVWRDYSTLTPAALRGTGGSFGHYSELQGGTARSMHDVNEEANPAPGGTTTQHRCGTCHNPHGNSNYRILRTTVNNMTGLNVTVRTDEDGVFLGYSTGFVKFCTACHTDYKATDDGNGNWIRHPVGVGLGNYTSEARFYANSTSYNPDVGLEAGGSISCVTCHFAHGSPAAGNMKTPGGSPVNVCKTCHDRSYNAGAQGSHAGFTGNDGTCSDCHSMHADGNAKLLKSGVETEICVNCHDSPGTSASPNKSHLDVWKGSVLDNPTSWFGTAGSFGAYDPVNGGNAPSMHPVNSEARIAPGDSATVVHCGTCHDSHGSTNYRLLKRSLNGKAGISVSATVDPQGRTTSYGGGMSGFCTACHKTYATSGSAAGYTRHPVDVAMTGAEMANYNHFQGSRYLPLESGNKVTCITCHFAHGSPYPYMKRLDGNLMCQYCHAKGLDPARNYADVTYTHGGFNGSSGNCLTCHYIHRNVNVFDRVTSLNRKMLVDAEETTLCYSCHAPDGPRRGGFPAAQVVWRGDTLPNLTSWDGTGGSFGASYDPSTGGTIRSHHDINKLDTPAPGGTTTEHRCGTCHNPHGNNNYRLLRDDVNGRSNISVKVGALGNYSSGMSSFCIACHTSYGDTGSGVEGYRRHPVNLTLSQWAQTNLATTPLMPKVQVENKKVMCLSCHFAHGSPGDAMLRMQTYTSSESEMCQQCHLKGYNKSRQQYRYTHGGFNGNRSNCRVCHTVHSKGNQKLLMEPKESQLCDNCHAGIAKFNEFKTHDPDVKIDAPSRFNVFSSIGNSFGNYSVGGGDVASWHEVDGTHTAPGGLAVELRCGKCHSPHGGDNFVMLRETVENTTSIRVFGHLSSTGPFNTYSSGFGRFCSACHTRLTSCGTGNPWTRHPVEFKLEKTQMHNWSTTRITPRVPIEAGSKVTCITCHNSHGSTNYYLQREEGNSMCQQCHNR